MKCFYSLLRPAYSWIIWSLSASFFYYKYLIQLSPGVMSHQLMSAYHLTGAQFEHLTVCFCITTHALTPHLRPAICPRDPGFFQHHLIPRTNRGT